MKKKLRPDFLIIGCERSGTHWVAALLDNHPQIACFPTLPFFNEIGEKRVGEMHFFNTLRSIEMPEGKKFVRPFEDFSYKYLKVFADLVDYKDKVSKEELFRIFQERYSEFCDKQRGDKKIVGEGTPAYIFHLDFINSLYPEMKKICIIRDPKDKVVSWHYNMVRKNRNKDDEITDDFINDYLDKRIIPEYEALLDYQGDVHCLTYESLSKDTAKSVEGLLNYLGMAVSGDIIKHMIKEADFKKQTARDSGEKGREKGVENIMSGFRKGVVGDWGNKLSQDQAELIDDKTKELRNKVFKKYKILTIES